MLREKDMEKVKLFTIRLASQFHAVNGANQLLSGVRGGNVVMLAFTRLLCKVSGKPLILLADKLCCVKQCVAKVSGAAFFHVGMAGLQLS